MRSLLARVCEKLRGRSHQKQNVEMVRQAVSGLKEDVQAISKRLNEYKESDDPLVSLMLDVFNDRAAIRPYLEEDKEKTPKLKK